MQRFYGMSRSARALNYAVRLHVLAWHGGRMAWALVPLAAIPAFVALALGTTALAQAQAAVAAGFLALGLGLRMLAPHLVTPGPTARRGREVMPGPQLNEAMVLVVLGFVVPGLALGWTLTAVGLPLDSALFEGISGITTTGLSTLPAPQALPWAVLFTRAFIQWYGGLGIVVLAVALVVGREAAAARSLAETQSIGEDLATSLRDRARRSLLVYGGLSLACLGATWAAGAPLDQALLYSMTAVSTAGFAPHSDSLAALPGWAPGVVLIAFSVLGAVTFSVYLQLARGTAPSLAARREALGLVVSCGVAVAALAAVLGTSGMAWGEVAVHAPLMALSAQTTTGLSSLDTGALPPLAWGVLMAAMLVGGNTGSTAGGLKTLRLLLIFRLLGMTVRRAAQPPNAVPRLRLFDRRVTPSELESIGTIVVLAFLTIGLSWLPFLAAGYGVDALFDVVSAVATTGLSTGVVGPDLAWPLKAVLMIDMVLGRLEFVAVIVLLLPSTWVGPKHVT